MKTLSANIPTSLGDIINLKAHFDSVKHEYDQINLTYHTALWNQGLHINEKQRQDWNNYLADLTSLFFSEKPYRMNNGQYKFYCTDALIKEIGIKPVKPKLASLLCKGDPLDIGPYIVFTTKVRGVKQSSFLPRSIEMWKSLNALSSKYKFVILGEREVEMRPEYQDPLIKDTIFGLYGQAITNLTPTSVVDRTIPALGNSQSTLKQIQQDCLIMNQAKAVITIGHGGNIGMAMASESNVIGYREPANEFAEYLFDNTAITKNWNQFINAISSI